MSTPALVATCWTSAGNVAPLDDPEVSPFSAIDRVRAAASTGWAGIGFAQGDLQVVRETVGFPALRAEIEAAGLRHVEVELASGWWRDDLAWRGTWELLLEAAHGLDASFIKVGTAFGSPVDDITPLVEPFRRIADEAAADRHPRCDRTAPVRSDRVDTPRRRPGPSSRPPVRRTGRRLLARLPRRHNAAGTR